MRIWLASLALVGLELEEELGATHTVIAINPNRAFDKLFMIYTPWYKKSCYNTNIQISEEAKNSWRISRNL
jgi:hypothetical protein